MANKFKVAAHYTGVSFGKAVKVGDEVIVETTYRDAQSLVKMAIVAHKVEGNELDEATKETSTDEKPAAKKPAAK